MKVKKLLTVLCTALALALCFAFAACNNDKEPDPAPATEYTVTFDANGGTLTGSATVKVESGKTISGAPSAAKAEHDFAGWYTLATDGDKIDLSTYKVTKDVTLYAHYTAKTVTPPAPSTKIEVTFNANGGTIAGENKIEVDENGNIFDLPEATREGYRFEAWYSAAEGGEIVDPMFDEITESTTLYAHWIKTYVVTFDAGEGTLTGEATVTVDLNAKIPAANVPAASKSGKEFHGWYTAAEGGDKVDFDTFTVTDNVTLYARFGGITMPVKTLKNHEGTAVGYTIEAEDCKYAVELPMWAGWMGVTTPVEIHANASGGKSLGWLAVAGNTLTFTFNAATAGKANISIRASSNNADANQVVLDQEVNNTLFDLKVNDAVKTFEPSTVRGSNQAQVYNAYWDTVALGEVDLIAGVNTVVITVKSDKMCNVDCFDIQTAVAVTTANGEAVSGESTLPAPPAPAVVYDKNVAVKLIVGGYAGGPAIEKAVLTFADDIPAAAVASANPFTVQYGSAVGGHAEDKVYLSNESGEKLSSAESSRYVTIEYKVTFGQYGANNNLNPFTYSQETSKNSWKALNTVTISLRDLTIGETTYTKFGGTVTATKEVPCLTDWKLDGTFSETITWGSDNARQINLMYGAYEPDALKNDSGKNPLIVWLHGGGEGGTDPSIAILGNQVTGLSADTVQKYFKAGSLAGAYVLAPQSPTQWMDIGDGVQASSPENSVYTESLFRLIKKYAEETNTDVDPNRIYIGGCSNGGWMTLELLADHGEYFAAAYPVSACYDTQYITDAMINKLKDIPIWFTHSKADGTLPICETQFQYYDPTHPEYGGYNRVTDTLKEVNTNELYIKLVNAGAENVYYSLFANVTVATGADAATYDGHWSWVYTFRDECKNVQTHTGTGTDGAFTLADLNAASTETVKLTAGGEDVTMWGWIAAQAKTPAVQA